MTLAQRFGSLGKNSGNPVKHTLRPFTTRHNNGLQPTRSASLRVRLNPTVSRHIVRHLFEGQIPQNELSRIGALVSHFGDEPIAFYHQLRNDLYDSLILETIESQQKIDISYLERLVSSNHTRITVEKLIEIGERKRANRPRNFIEQVPPSKGASHVATNI